MITVRPSAAHGDALDDLDAEPALQLFVGTLDLPHADEMRDLLAPHGFLLTVFDDPAELVRAVVTTSADLVLIDLAGLSSRELALCTDLRRRSSVPLVVLSPRATEMDVVLALEVGADAYIVKPYRPREFVARLRAVLRRPRSDHHHVGAMVRAGDISLYVEERRVQIGRRIVTIPGREFELLKLLMERPGRAVPRVELLQRLTPDADGGRASLDSCIRRLRGYIEEDASMPRRLVAVRGYGYRLKPVVVVG